MRRIRSALVAAVATIGVLGPAGFAIAHELPGQGCEHAADGKNKHCGEHAHGEGSEHDDGDGVPAQTSRPLDNCPDAYNPEQGDVDGDGVGNVCDHVLDGDDDGGSCDAPPELCGTPEPRERRDPPGYAPDTDGDGFSDEDEDPVGAD